MLTQGIWYVKILFICSTKGLKALTPFSQGFRVVSLNVTSGNEKELVLASFSKNVFERENRALVFQSERYFRITHPSDKIYFQVQTLSGDEVEIEEDGQLLLGIGLIRG